MHATLKISLQFKCSQLLDTRVQSIKNVFMRIFIYLRGYIFIFNIQQSKICMFYSFISYQIKMNFIKFHQNTEIY